MISNTKLFGSDMFRTESGGATFLAGELLLLRHIYVFILPQKKRLHFVMVHSNW